MTAKGASVTSARPSSPLVVPRSLRGMGRLITRISQILGGGGLILRRLWYVLLLRFPLPAENRWQVSLRLLRSLILGQYQVAKERYGVTQAHALVARSLHRAGRMWVEQQLSVSTSPAAHSGPLADSLMVALRSLELPSQVRSNYSNNNVTVTTFRCPFVEEARSWGESPAMVCQHTCGELKSLFKGISEGFPSFVQYRAPRRMGTGAEVCVKEFNMHMPVVRRDLRKARARG